MTLARPPQGSPQAAALGRDHAAEHFVFEQELFSPKFVRCIINNSMHDEMHDRQFEQYNYPILNKNVHRHIHDRTTRARKALEYLCHVNTLERAGSWALNKTPRLAL